MAEHAVEIQLVVPPELENGTYANFVQVWNAGPHDFTLDFAVTGLPRQTEKGGPVTVPAPVVARIKVSPSLIFSIAQAIAENVNRYETLHGTITPRPPDSDLRLPFKSEEESDGTTDE